MFLLLFGIIFVNKFERILYFYLCKNKYIKISEQNLKVFENIYTSKSWVHYY